MRFFSAAFGFLCLGLLDCLLLALPLEFYGALCGFTAASPSLPRSAASVLQPWRQRPPLARFGGALGFLGTQALQFGLLLVILLAALERLS